MADHPDAQSALVLQIGDLRVETGTATVSRDGHSLPLPKLTFDLLMALARAAPNLVAIDELMNQVWPGLVVEVDTVSQRVKLLRQALGDDPRHPHYIAGVRGRGYRLVCSVTPITITTNGADAATTPVATRRRLWIASLAAVAVAALGFLLLQSGFGDRTTNDADNGRIAITKFETLTNTGELERFAKEVGATIIRVFATNGIHTIVGDQSDSKSDRVSTAGAEFELRGRVDRDGDDLVASADIVNRHDGLVLWSTTMRRNSNESRLLQDRFSIVVATVLRCELRGRQFVDDRSTDLLAQGFNLCFAFSYDIERTPELARQLVESAPRSAYLRSVEALANALVSIAPTSSGASRPPGEVARLREVVYDSAKTAAEIDPRLSYTALALALVADPAVGLSQRETFLNEAIHGRATIDAQPAALESYARLLESVGRIRDARVYLERAVSLNPLELRPRAESAFLTAWLGNTEAARDQLQEMRGKDPDFLIDYQRMWTELWFGDPTIAKSIHTEINVAGLKASPRGWPCVTGVVDARANHRQLTGADIESACGAGREWAFWAYLGYADGLFRKFDEPPPDRINDSLKYLFSPQARTVRADPRFMPLAASQGLVDYWLDTDQWPDFCSEEKLPYDCKEAALAARTANDSVEARLVGAALP